MLRNFKNDKDFYASLPKKRIGAGALLFYKNELLIVQPTYNPGWILPGGTIQSEESPTEGLIREVQEEVNLKIIPTELLSIDYISNKDAKGEYLQLLFAAEALKTEQIQNILVQEYELRDYKFMPLEKALDLLTPPVAYRVYHTLKHWEQHQGAIYLENGKPCFHLLNKKDEPIHGLYDLPRKVF